MAVGLILAAVSAGMKLYGGYKAKKEAGEQAAYEERLTKEELRRMDILHKQQIGSSISRAGASGIELTSGSTQDFLSGMKEEFAVERVMLAQTGAITAGRIRQQGRDAQTAAVGGAIQTGIGALYSYSQTRNELGDSGSKQNVDIGAVPSYVQKGKGGTGTGVIKNDPTSWFYR